MREEEREPAAPAPRLKPPKNYRGIFPHCCATCEHLSLEYDELVCSRPGGPKFPINLKLEYLHTCDGWKQL